MLTGELRYDYGFTHADWGEILNHREQKVIQEGLFPKTKHLVGGTERFSRQSMQNQPSNVEENKAADTKKNALNTLPNVGTRNRGYQQSTESAQNQSSKFEKTKAADTVVKALNPLLSDGRDTESGISTKSAEHKPCKVEKNKVCDTVEVAPYLIPKDGGTRN